MASTERRSARGTHDIALASVLSLSSDGAGASKTERDLAFEVATSFALSDVVAEMTGLPPETPLPELTGALRMRLNERAELHATVASLRSRLDRMSQENERLLKERSA